ncbi:uncharacterized protein [Bemisia tabaci]|uniref:uncharacterized protein n=1 Tax=Bemisia tabaci TaxID=7038 RepID=UPI003B27DE0E
MRKHIVAVISTPPRQFHVHIRDNPELSLRLDNTTKKLAYHVARASSDTLDWKRDSLIFGEYLASRLDDVLFHQAPRLGVTFPLEALSGVAHEYFKEPGDCLVRRSDFSINYGYKLGQLHWIANLTALLKLHFKEVTKERSFSVGQKLIAKVSTRVTFTGLFSTAMRRDRFCPFSAVLNLDQMRS